MVLEGERLGGTAAGARDLIPARRQASVWSARHRIAVDDGPLRERRKVHGLASRRCQGYGGEERPRQVTCGPVIGRDREVIREVVQVLCSCHVFALLCPLQYHSRVVAADAEVGAEGRLEVRGLARLVYDVIQLGAVLGQLAQVPHRGDGLLLYGHGADGCLYGPARTQRVAQGRLGGGDPGVRVDLGHRPGLGAVARDGACTVRVDVSDLLAFEPRVRYGELHGPQNSEALRVRVGDVVRVGGAPHAGHLGVGLGAAALDGLGALEDHHRGALADKKAIVVCVVGPAGPLGIVVAAAHGAHRDKPGDDHGRDRRLRGAADHYVGVAAADEVEAEAHHVRAAAARQSARRGGTLHAELDGYVGRAGVRHDLGDRERVDPGGTPAVYGRLGRFHACDAPDAAAEDQTNPLWSRPKLVPRAGVLEGELGGGEAHLGEAIRPGRELAIHEIVRVEVRALGGDPHLVALWVEERYGPGTALVRQQRAPEPLAAYPDGANHPYTRYVSRRASVVHLTP